MIATEAPKCSLDWIPTLERELKCPKGTTVLIGSRVILSVFRLVEELAAQLHMIATSIQLEDLKVRHNNQSGFLASMVVASLHTHAKTTGFPYYGGE